MTYCIVSTLLKSIEVKKEDFIEYIKYMDQYYPNYRVERKIRNNHEFTDFYVNDDLCCFTINWDYKENEKEEEK